MIVIVMKIWFEKVLFYVKKLLMSVNNIFYTLTSIVRFFNVNLGIVN